MTVNVDAIAVADGDADETGGRLIVAASKSSPHTAGMLSPCRDCRRHVYAEERQCPFCGASVRVRRAPFTPDLRLSRAAQALFALLVASSGCQSSIDEPEVPRAVPTGSPAPTSPEPTSRSDSDVEGQGGAAAEASEEGESAPNRVAIYGSSCIMFLEKVLFVKESDALPDMGVTVDAVREIIEGRPSLVLEVRGHADKEEREPVALAERRARRVYQAMLAGGVPAASLRLGTCSFDMPVEEKGSHANRRVQFVIIGGLSDGEVACSPARPTACRELAP